jgi:hypothetical protein
MEAADRKAASAACKERKTAPGIYAVRCGATGRCWIGRALDIDAIQNRLWFTLRQGSASQRTLQAAWCEHGPDAFAFESVERLDPEALPYVRDRLLKERLIHWCTALGGEAI